MKFGDILILAGTIATALFGSLITSGSVASWYKTIKLPSWTPSGGVIGAVWTFLFILAATSALLVWNKIPHGSRVNLIIALFIVNAFLNVGWSYLFFGKHLIGTAVFEAALLALSVLALIVAIWPVHVSAAALLIPYFLWASFATYLTYSVWLLNR